MNLLWFAIAIAVAVVVVSFTDWFFAGYLFHSRYLDYPQTWRGGAGEPETSRILWSTVYSAISCAAFIWVAVRLLLLQPHHAFKFAFAAWVIGPLPVIGTYFVWIKMHPLNAVSHALSWLVRFVVCALCVAYIYRGH
jgi:hypothetical protein